MTGFGGEMKRRLALAGLTQTALAALLPIDKGQISRLASGVRQPSPELARQIDDALGAGGELAKLAPPRQPRQRIVLPDTGLGDDRRRPMDGDDVQGLRADVDRLVALDTGHGSDGLHVVASRAFRDADLRLAQAGARPGVASDVAAAVAELGETAAWIAYDCEEHDQSRRLACDALLVARLAGDRSMERFLLSHLAMQAVQLGRPAEALSIADRVLAERPVSPRVAAIFRTRRGRALGLLGAQGEGLAELDAARQIVAQGCSGGDPPWSWWLHDAELAIQEGRLRAACGDPRGAVDAAVAAIRLLPAGQGRDGLLHRGWLLRWLVEAHAWSEVPAAAASLRVGGAGSARLRPILAGALAVVDGRSGVRAPRAVRDAVRTLAAVNG
jgi:transcriptional regulator with XRE-family HTH domain